MSEPTVHLISPSVLHSSVACGGTSLYRGVAVAATAVGPTICHELRHPDAEGDVPWHAPGVEIRCHESADDLMSDLWRTVQPGDILGKWLNAAGPREAQTDIAVAEVAGAVGGRCFYLDPEPFCRLPFIAGAPHYLWEILPAYTGVIVFAGGPRAAAQYVANGHTAAWDMSACLGRLAHRAPVGGAPRDIDVIVTVARESSRESRLAVILADLLRLRPQTDVCVVGGVSAETLGLPEIHRLPPRDPSVLLGHYGRARFTVNMTRPDFDGYTHTAAARVFEAAQAESCLVTDAFPGLEDILAPGRECLIGVEAIAAHVDLPEPARQAMADRAAQRVDAAAERDRRRLAEILTGAPRQEHLRSDAVAAARSRLDLRSRCRGLRAALLPGAERWRPLIEELEPSVLSVPGSAATAVAGGYDVVVVPAADKEELDTAARRAGRRVATVIVAPPIDRALCLRLVWGRDWLMPGTERRWI
jgi:hypothetical protein